MLLIYRTNELLISIILFWIRKWVIGKLFLKNKNISLFVKFFLMSSLKNKRIFSILLKRAFLPWWYCDIFNNKWSSILNSFISSLIFWVSIKVIKIWKFSFAVWLFSSSHVIKFHTVSYNCFFKLINWNSLGRTIQKIVGNCEYYF